MADYRPSLPFTVPMYLLVPTTTVKKGVAVKAYPEVKDAELIYCSFKTYGGTESVSNDVMTVLDTANVETWYRPDITASCRLCIADQPTKFYEVIGQPENINLRNQFVKFKVQAVGGGA